MANWGAGATGAATGAMAGASFGPIGAGLGAVGGGLAGLFSSKPKDKTRQFPTLNPQQQEALSGILGQLGQGGTAGQNYGLAQQYQNQMLQGGPEAYKQWAAPYQTQFQEQVLPGIAERYSGLGGGLGGGAQSSSGFGQALGGAASQFQSNLAGLYAQLQQHAAQQAFGQHNTLAGLGIGTQAFQNAYQPGNLGLFGNIAGGLGQGLGQSFGRNIGLDSSKGGSNFMDLFRKGPSQSESIQDTYGPNAGTGFYNPYTGTQGY